MNTLLRYTYLLLFSASGLVIHAQEAEVIEANSLMSLGTRPSYEIRFVKVEKDMVEDMWEDYTEDRFDEKLREKDEEFYMKDIKAEDFIAKKFTLYSKIQESGDQIALMAWFDTGDSFVNSTNNAEASERIKNFMATFQNKVRRAKINKMLEVENEQLEDLKDDLEDLKKDNEDMKEDIQQHREEIKEAENKISENEKAQAELQRKIQTQNNTVMELQKQMDNIGKTDKP